MRLGLRLSDSALVAPYIQCWLLGCEIFCTFLWGTRIAYSAMLLIIFQVRVLTIIIFFIRSGIGFPTLDFCSLVSNSFTWDLNLKQSLVQNTKCNICKQRATTHYSPLSIICILICWIWKCFTYNPLADCSFWNKLGKKELFFWCQTFVAAVRGIICLIIWTTTF